MPHLTLYDINKSCYKKAKTIISSIYPDWKSLSFNKRRKICNEVLKECFIHECDGVTWMNEAMRYIFSESMAVSYKSQLDGSLLDSQ